MLAALQILSFIISFLHSKCLKSPGHAFTFLTKVFLCLSCHLMPPSVSATAPAASPAHPHPRSTAHKLSVIPVVITAGHNFRDNLKTIYYPWSIKKQKTSIFWMLI